MGLQIIILQLQTLTATTIWHGDDNNYNDNSNNVNTSNKLRKKPYMWWCIIVFHMQSKFLYGTLFPMPSLPMFFKSTWSLSVLFFSIWWHHYCHMPAIISTAPCPHSESLLLLCWCWLLLRRREQWDRLCADAVSLPCGAVVNANAVGIIQHRYSQSSLQCRLPVNRQISRKTGNWPIGKPARLAGRLAYAIGSVSTSGYSGCRHIVASSVFGSPRTKGPKAAPVAAIRIAATIQLRQWWGDGGSATK